MFVQLSQPFKSAVCLDVNKEFPHVLEMRPALSMESISVIEMHDPSTPSGSAAVAAADGFGFSEDLIALGSMTIGDFLQPVPGRKLLN